MKATYKLLSALAAGVLLTTGVSSSFPAYQKSAAQLDSVLSFAEQLSRSQEKAPFARLEFSGKTGQIRTDGHASGTSSHGFLVSDGRLCVETTETLTAAEIADGDPHPKTISLETAAERIGCEVYEEGDTVVVSSPFMNGEVIVKADGEIPLYGGTEIASGFRSLHVVKFPTAADAYAAYLKYRDDPAIEYADANRILSVAEEERETPGEYWGTDLIGAEQYITDLRDSGFTFPELHVAVIDTGIYPEHEWFKDRIAEGGMSFIDENNGSFEDHHSHGTHCSGIICMSTPETVKILPVKALSDSGFGSSVEIYCAMMYAAEQKADVVSMSLGGLGISPLLKEAAEYLCEQDIPVFVAAGNETMDVKYSHPANNEGVFSISALECNLDDDGYLTAEEGQLPYILAEYSNFGPGIDFAAPGSDILSAGIYAPNDLETKSGTSMATPYAAACAADILLQNPALSNDALYQVLKNSALDLGEDGFDEQFGWGCVCLTDVTISEQDVAAPVFSETSGKYAQVLSVTLSSADADAKIYYSVDGADFVLYQGDPITVAKSEQITAYAEKDGERSRRVHASYTITVEPPTVSLSGGIFTARVSTTLTADKSARIYYTLDGTQPVAGTSALYQKGQTLTFSETTVLRAVAMIGQTVSAELCESYIIGGKGYDKLFRVEDGTLMQYFGKMSKVNVTDMLSGTELTAVGDSAFENCHDIVSVTLPDTVRKLGDNAFRGCEHLETVAAPGVTEIGRNTFAGDDTLLELSIGQLTAIPDGAFSGCAVLSAFGLDLSKVTTIGANAFESCFNLTMAQFNWEKITEIGDYAFHSSNLSADMDLKSLNSLGRYAFSCADGVGSVILPETITEIPDHCFESCLHLGYLKAPGVTKLGDFAIFRDESFTHLELDISFEKLTEIGSDALNWCEVKGAVSFDALTKVYEDSLMCFTAQAMYFPSLKTIASYSVSNCFTDLLYFDAVEYIEPYGVVMVDNTCLAVGDSLKRIDEFGIPSSFGEANTELAGPANSPLQEYARKYSMHYTVTPSMLIPEHPLYVSQYQDIELHAYILGDAKDIRWTAFAEDDEEGKAVSHDGSLCHTIMPQTAFSGVTHYDATLVLSDGTDGETFRTVLTVTPLMLAADITETVTLIDWRDYVGETFEEDPYSEYAYTALSSYIDPIKFTYTASEAGDYYIYASAKADAVKVIRKDGTSMQQTGDIYDLSTMDSFPLAKGETVDIFVQNQSRELRVDSLTVTQNLAKKNLSAGGVILMDNTLYPYTDEPVTPGWYGVNFYDYKNYTGEGEPEGEELTEGKDYVIRYLNNDKVGNSRMFAIGIGDYTGAVDNSFSIYGALTADTAERVPYQAMDSVFYKFVPKTTGTYTIYTSFGKEDITECFEWNYFDFYSPDTYIQLYDGEMNIFDSNDDAGSSYLSALTTKLNKGETYYISVAFNNAATTYVNLCADSSAKTHIGCTDIHYPTALNYGAGEVVFPIYADNGDRLTQGTDYTQHFFGLSTPGMTLLTIEGIGDYCGSTSFNLSFASNELSQHEISYTTKYEPGETISFTGIKKMFLFSVMDDSIIEIAPTDPTDTEPYHCLIFDSYGGDWQISGVASNTNAEIFVSSGEHLVVAEYPYPGDHQSREFTIRILSSEPSIERMVVASDPVYYTGEPIIPKPDVYDPWTDEHLEENVDYYIELIQDIIKPGQYEYRVIGSGRFKGTCSGWQTVLPTVDMDIKELSASQFTLESGIMVSFTADAKKYCIAKNDLRNASLKIYTGKMDEIASLSGAGYVYQEFDTVPGAKYYVIGDVMTPDHTGELEFRLTSDYQLLDNCTVEMEPAFALSEVNGTPPFRILDGDTVLTEGTDYSIVYTTVADTPGRTEMELIGMGHYIGIIYQEYYLYPDFDDIKSLDSSGTILLDNPDFEMERGYPGDLKRFTFTADAAGTYFFNLPTSENIGVCSFIYREDGTCVPYPATRVELNKNETVTILTVTDELEGFFELPNLIFTVGVNSEVPESYFSDDNGVFYHVSEGRAIIEGLPYDLTGIDIPAEVYCEEYDCMVPVEGALLEMMEGMSDNVTFYCTPGSTFWRICETNGYCFADPDSKSNIAGDVTGDGAVNFNDVTTLQRWLAELSGMKLSEAAYACADYNGDGVITAADCALIAAYL